MRTRRMSIGFFICHVVFFLRTTRFPGPAGGGEWAVRALVGCCPPQPGSRFFCLRGATEFPAFYSLRGGVRLSLLSERVPQPKNRPSGYFESSYSVTAPSETESQGPKRFPSKPQANQEVRHLHCVTIRPSGGPDGCGPDRDINCVSIDSQLPR